MSAIEIVGQEGATIYKQPGEVNGESVILRDLKACEVFILDYSGDVQIINVQDSKLFIGPVDGAAIVEQVLNSQLAVSAQQFQAKDSSNSRFYLQVVTVPTLSNCENIQIGCWQGAYPGLTQHFQQANLDPKINRWQEVRDLNEGFMPSFDLTYENDPWEIPIEGYGAPENPVPFGSPNGGTENGGLYGLDQPNQPVLGNGHLEAADFSEEPTEHPKLKEINDRLRERQETQQAREQTVKTELIQKATSHLEKFYADRQKKIENRSKLNRDNEQTLPSGGVEGNTEWDRAVNLVDFGFSRPNGTDLSRFKNVLFTAKSKNVPNANNFGA